MSGSINWFNSHPFKLGFLLHNLLSETHDMPRLALWHKADTLIIDRRDWASTMMFKDKKDFYGSDFHNLDLVMLWRNRLTLIIGEVNLWYVKGKSVAERSCLDLLLNTLLCIDRVDQTHNIMFDTCQFYSDFHNCPNVLHFWNGYGHLIRQCQFGCLQCVNSGMCFWNLCCKFDGSIIKIRSDMGW